MKVLKNLSDRKNMYRIEAARVSYLICESSYNELRNLLTEFEDRAPSFSDAIVALRLVWEFVDFAFRFLSVINQIKGLKHKEQAYQLAQDSKNNITKARNFFQHLNTSIPIAGDYIYPIAGAIVWPSRDRTKSYILSAGTIPNGTFLHSHKYDQQEQKYLDEVILNFDTFSVDIQDSYIKLSGAQKYLDEWLDEKNCLDDKDLDPTYLTFSSLGGLGAKRYLRVQAKVFQETNK